MASSVPPSSSIDPSLSLPSLPPVTADSFPSKIRNAIEAQCIESMPVANIENLDITPGYPQGVIAEGGFKGRNANGCPFIRFPVYNTRYKEVVEQRRAIDIFGFDTETSPYAFITIVIEGPATMCYVDKTIPTTDLNLYLDGVIAHAEFKKYAAIGAIFKGTHPDLTLGTGPQQNLQDESKMKMPLGVKKV